MNDITSQVPSDPRLATEPAGAGAAPAAPDAAPPIDVRLPRPRVWPGVVIVALMWLGMLVPGWVAPATMAQFMAMFWGPMVGAAAVLLWWLFASRVRWRDALLIPLACAAVGTGAYFLYHHTVGVFGLIMAALPAAVTAWVVWLLLTPFLNWPVRRAGLLGVLVLAWGYHALLRFDGVSGDMQIARAWRWSKTHEERFLEEIAAGRRKIAPAAPAPAERKPELLAGDWPGFRGARRDGRLTGVRIAADWDKRRPREVWRQKIGPGWSSFAVVGDRLYTQEQRGEAELVVCYNADTGEEVWAHSDKVRFTETVAGPGPRATPTFHEGKIYALGARGTLNCLDAATGAVVWARDILADSGAKLPMWGFASSPLVAHGVVTVFAGGPDGKSVLGYEAKSGQLAWYGGDGKLSYCSPQLATLAGVEQVLITTDAGLTAFEPGSGEVLWKHSWPSEEVARIVQPALLGGDDLLVGTGMGIGTRRLHVDKSGAQWADKEVWTTRAIKPYYNDLVVHGDHLYGFDGNFFTCVSLKDGKSKWRARGYGNGQVLLLADQGLLCILAETGEVALVEAVPDEHRERGRFKAFDGKTWNHPVVSHGKLFVRNGEEMVCYRLAEEDDK